MLTQNKYDVENTRTDNPDENMPGAEKKYIFGLMPDKHKGDPAEDDAGAGYNQPEINEM
jgi:hypothetical protein